MSSYSKFFCMLLGILMLCTALIGCRQPKAPEDGPEPTAAVGDGAPDVPPSEPEAFRPAPQTKFEKRLDFAFGLFSIGITEDFDLDDTAGHLFGMERYKNEDCIISVNYAPREAYENTAQRTFNSYISYAFAVFMGVGSMDYSETEWVNETWPGGLTASWQIMTTEHKCILFEVFTPKFGYNAVIFWKNQKDDGPLLDMLYSFAFDETLEKKILNQRQINTSAGLFTSVDNALTMQLTNEWEPEPMIIGPNHVFGAQRDFGKQMIEMMRFPQIASFEDLSDAFDNMIEQAKGSGMFGAGEWGEKKGITLPNLGEDAYMQEVAWQGGITCQYVMFSYRHYAYFGNFMWVTDSGKRAEVEKAMLSLSPAFY